MKRRQFLFRVAGTLATVPIVAAWSGCDDDDDGDDDDDDSGGPDASTAQPDASTAQPDASTAQPDANAAANCIANGTEVVIGTNHGHTMTVSAGDVAAGTEKTYDIQGTSAHPHTVVVTAEHFAELASGNSVTVVSSNDNDHTHSVTVSCV